MDTLFRRGLSLFFTLLVGTAALAQDYSAFIPLGDYSVLALASPEKAEACLTQEDTFIQQLSAFDLASRTGKEKQARLSDYYKVLAKSPKKWRKKDIKTLQALSKSVADRFVHRQLRPVFPDTIVLIQTREKDEGGANYSRGKCLVLHRDNLTEPQLIHALFHVLSRQNPALREGLYASIGFNSCNAISFPESLKNRLITNPDCPRYDNYIMLSQEGRHFPATMITYSKTAYHGGNLFQYLHKGLVELQKDAEGNMQVKLQDGHSVVHDYTEVQNLYHQIGRNTLFNIHPEEICAEHFVFWMLPKSTIVNPAPIQAMRAILQAKANE